MANHLQKLAAALLACSLLFAGCGAGGNGSTSTAATATNGFSDAVLVGERDKGTGGGGSEDMAMESTASYAPDGDAGAPDILSTQKIIQYLEYEIEALEFDESMTALEKLCKELGGYVQESSRSGGGNRARLRQAYFVLRIPSGKLEQFQKGAEEVGTVTRASSSSDNVTEKYYDIEARLKSLRVQEERLLALMEKSETLTDVIELEKALAEVTYEIETLTSSLRRYDSLVDYSTVTVTLQEVVAYTEASAVPRTLGQRISQRFSSSLKGLADFGQGLLVAVLGSAPVLLFLAALFCAVFFPVRHMRKKKRRGTTEQAAPPPAPEKPQE